MSRHGYPSDLSREQFERIKGMLEGNRHKTRPRQVDLYDVFCAILYLLKNAAVWRALPSDFPSISTVRYYFDQWNKPREGEQISLLEQALKKSSGTRTGTQRAQQLDALLHRGCAKRQEHRYGRFARVTACDCRNHSECGRPGSSLDDVFSTSVNLVRRRQGDGGWELHRRGLCAKGQRDSGGIGGNCQA
jgi:transposase